MADLFDKHITLLNKGLDFRSKRNSLISSNIANRETPGYRAKDIVFEKALNKALHSDRPGPLKTTNARHFDGIERHPLHSVKGTQINSANPDPKMDGNTVNLDKEMAKLAENQIMYSALTRMIGWKFRMLKTASSDR
ncbi:MAG: flagellar basal-body rod protein FlgB [bacterium]|jgi:flagellar basal-body rod protein FlgB